MVKASPAATDTQGMQLRSPSQEGLLEKETSIFLPGKSHGQRDLVGYNSWNHKESVMTERLNTHTHTHTHVRAREMPEQVNDCARMRE